MAKSSRASSRKANNQRLKANVFGPVEAARAERLSAKLLELAAQPKPEAASGEMKIVDEDEAANAEEEETAKENNDDEDDTAMDVDTTTVAAAAKKPALSKRATNKNRILKRKKSSKVVFALYKDKKPSKRKH